MSATELAPAPPLEWLEAEPLPPPEAWPPLDEGATGELLRAIKARVDSGRGGAQTPALLALAEAQAARHPASSLPGLAAWIGGNAAIISARWADALRAFERAAPHFLTVGDTHQWAALRVGEIGARLRLGDHAGARLVAREILPVLRAQEDTARVAAVAANLGAIAVAEQRPHTALRWYGRAMRRYRTLGRTFDVGRMLIDSAYALLEMNEVRRARRRLHQARRLFMAAGITVHLHRIDMDLGVLEARRGHFGRALRLLRRAHDGFLALGQRAPAAVAEADLCRVFLSLNLSEEVLARTERLPEELQGTYRYDFELAAVAAARAMGDLHAARQRLTLLQTTLASVDLPVWQAQAALEAASLALDEGELEATQATAQRAAETFRRQRLALPTALAELLVAAAALEQGALETAGKALARVERITARYPVRTLRWRHSALAARYALASGDEVGSAQALEAAIESVEALRGTVPLDEWRAGFLDDKLALYTDRAALALQAGDLPAAWQWAERGKARALADMLGHQEGPPHADEGAGADLARLEDEVRDLEGQLSAASWRPEAARQRRQAERRLAACYQQLQLAQRAPDAPHLELPDLAAVQATLAPDEALIEYLVTGREGRISAFLLTHDRLECFPEVAYLPDLWGPLTELLRFDLDDFRLLPPDAWDAPDWLARTQAHLQTFYAALVAPLRPWLTASRRLTIVPHGQLFYLPFHALHDGEGYVADQWEVRVVPSAASAVLCASLAARRATTAEGSPLVVGVSAEGWLPEVETEVAAVAGALRRARVLREEAATPTALRAAAPGSTLLHIAAHAEFRADNPLFSCLLLGGGHPLHVYAIRQLALRDTALVTLSACETGVSAVQGGDLMGLAQGFFAAGAPSLVVSLWPVLDAATAPLMEAFYQALAAGEGKAAALRTAQATIRQRFPHPYLWAPFVLLGDASPLPDGWSARP